MKNSIDIQDIDGEFCIDIVSKKPTPEYALIATGPTKLKALEAAIHNLEELINEAKSKAN